MNTGVPMTEVAVVTDSCASIPEYLLEHLSIRTVAYYIHHGQAYQQMANMVAEVVGKSKAKIAYVHVGAQREVEKLRELVEAFVGRRWQCTQAPAQQACAITRWNAEIPASVNMEPFSLCRCISIQNERPLRRGCSSCCKWRRVSLGTADAGASGGGFPAGIPAPRRP